MMRGLSSGQVAACSIAVLLVCASVARGQEALKPEELKKRLAESGKAVGEKLYQELRKAVKDQEAKVQPVLDANPPAKPGAMTDAEKTKIRGLLAKAWSDALDAPIKASLSQIDTERLKTLDALQATGSKVGAVNDAFRGVRTTIEQQLQGLRAEDKVKTRLDSWDPSGSEAKTKAQEILEKLTADISAAFGTEWGRGETKVVTGFSGPSTGQQIAEVAAEIDKITKTHEAEYYQELRKTTGFSRVVRCVLGANAVLACSPDLRISAADVGEIVISNLPADKTVIVAALTADEILPAIQDPNPSTNAGTKAEKSATAFDTQVQRLQNQLNHHLEEHPQKDRETNASPFTCPSPSNSEKEWRKYLSCDEVVFAPGQGGTVLIGVYKGRRFRPVYGGFVPNSENAFETLRGSNEGNSGSRKGLSLLISGSVSQILLRVRVVEDNTLATTTIPVGYERWGFETGGFFAITTLTDEGLIQQTSTDENTPANEKVEILRVTDTERISQETGIFLNFIPRNYPSLGIGIGFSSNSGQPISAYAGPSFRLRSFGQRGIANFSTGFAMRSVKRYPGVDRGDKFPVGSPLLNGQDEYHVAPYFLLQLGFSFGPIPGPEGNGTSTTTSGNP
jgi:hypothetical protein